MMTVATSNVLTGPVRLLFPRNVGIGEAKNFPFALLGEQVDEVLFQEHALWHAGRTSAHAGACVVCIVSGGMPASDQRTMQTAFRLSHCSLTGSSLAHRFIHLQLSACSTWKFQLR